MKQNLKKGNMKELKQQAAALLQIKGFRVDYIETADAGTLELLSEWDGETPVVALTAAFLGEVRLIDNMVLT